MLPYVIAVSGKRRLAHLVKEGEETRQSLSNPHLTGPCEPSLGLPAGDVAFRQFGVAARMVTIVARNRVPPPPGGLPKQKAVGSNPIARSNRQRFC